MAELDDLVERARSLAGADFAFVLTRHGRLVTRAAPQEMPDVGRQAIVGAVREMQTSGRKSARVVEVTLPRQDLVPYGGAAPVDVFAGMASEAILAIVMASWADKSPVLPVALAALGDLETLISTKKRRTKSRGQTPTATVSARSNPASRARRASSVPPPSRSRTPATLAAVEGQARPPRRKSTPNMPAVKPPPKQPPSRPPLNGLVSLAQAAVKISNRKPSTRPPVSSAPELFVREVDMGRATQEAIEREGQESLPKSSAPDVRVELASLGHISEVDLRRAEAKRMQSFAQIPGKLVAGAAGRSTQPWVESPVDTKRFADAASYGRKIAPPKVTVRLEDEDTDLRNVIRREEPEPQPPPKRKSSAPPPRRARKTRP